MADPLLEVRGLTAAYGRSQVLFGVDLEVGAGEMTSLLGRNGMGKTTTVYSIMGLVPPLDGSVRMAGREISGQPPWRIGQAGLGLVPEARQVFPNLSTHENLIATARPPAAAEAGAAAAATRAGGRRSASTSCSPPSRSAAAPRGRSSPAASSRCCPSGAPS